MRVHCEAKFMIPLTTTKKKKTSGDIPSPLTRVPCEAKVLRGKILNPLTAARKNLSNIQSSLTRVL